jgi:hypothetical protein
LKVETECFLEIFIYKDFQDADVPGKQNQVRARQATLKTIQRRNQRYKLEAMANSYHIVSRQTIPLSS